MDLSDYRKEIDELDDILVNAFRKRMDVVAKVGEYKKAHNLPILDATREQNKLISISEKVPEEYQDYLTSLYSLIFELSRSYENRRTGIGSEMASTIRTALSSTRQLFPEKAKVICQGVEGAYSQIATDRLFKMAKVNYVKNFGDVFAAIENGEAQYGVIPVENSTAGSVNKVYDLMMEHHFHIVKSVRIKVDHNLLVKNGTNMEDIREIFSHEQAINQSAGFLKKYFPNAKITAAANTAVAAKMVAESDRNDVAALSSRSCIDLYGLKCLKSSVQDKANNFTRFICISKNLEIYPGADRTSLMVVLPHRSGALFKCLSRFYALGINLIKLESRPIPDRNFEFMFYFDIEASVYSPQFMQLMSELSSIAEEYAYLGSYNEVV